MKLLNRESGVSPVIGVILMVALTVILAAIVGSYVFSHASNVEKTRIVESRAIQLNDTYGEFILIGGPDGRSVNNITVSMTNSLNVKSNSTKYGVTVGDVLPLYGTTSGNDHVVAVATFNDGKQQVILDTFI